MEWTAEAEAAIKKVPFFVRKRVRQRVEQEAREAGKKTISLEEVKATQARYLANMKSEVQGYRIETCFGPGGCPNRAVISEGLAEKIEAIVKKANLVDFLRQQVGENLKFHHEFRITLADCPNACSQPQIKDIGIIGACTPRLTEEPCTLCRACVDACREEAVLLEDGWDRPQIDAPRCVHCGKCIQACPTGTLAEEQKGYRVQLGGKLGRHPQLARELPGIYTESQVLALVADCLKLYKQKNRRGKRFGEILTPDDLQSLAERHGKKGER